jgi:3',5'-cyclic AMP phosphodiesterase CpdA
MKVPARAARAAVFAILALCLAGPIRGAEPRTPAPPDDVPRFRARNLDLVSRFLSESSAREGRLDDYYFVLIGDIQNSVRDFRHDVFNALARDIHGAVDEKTGERLYDRIRFVVLTGDLVYEGPSPRQWEALGKAFAGRGPDGTPYPYIELLARDKPIIPVIGNHELLSFRPYFQTRYKDLFDSPLGVARFKRFFDWDSWIADPRILYPVPADLPEKRLREILAKLPDAADRGLLSAAYGLRADGRYHLGFYDRPPLAVDMFREESEKLAAGLAPVFRRAGYGTVPVLNSDNMIDYAFEAGGAVYLVLDSMARGWQYPGFTRLKDALYPEKKDQHRLNLFTPSPFNGQSVFYRAVAEYAREKGLTLVPLMHSPTFNSSRSIYQTGVGYNTWLALGLPQAEGEQGEPTIFDDMLFADAPVLFGACVHAYEHLTVVAKSPGRPDHTLECYISGGGGGPLRKDFLPGKVTAAADLYNQKLGAGAGAGRSIEITGDVTGVGHHYLLVHVVGGRIVSAVPHFLDPRDLRRPTFQPQVALSASLMSRPSSTGASLEFSPGAWGIEGVVGYLTFINWRPTVNVGFVNYDTWGTGTDVQAYAFTLEVSPLNLECHLPRANVVTLRLPGFEVWDGRGSLRRYFMTMGVEAPLLYDIFGTFERLRFGIKAYVPLNLGGAYDPDFGRRTKFALSIGYRFRL